MEIITAFNEKNNMDVLKSSMGDMDISVMTAEEAGISFTPGKAGSDAEDNSDINAEVLWNKTQDSGRMCFVLTDAVSDLSEGTCALTLMAADGSRQHFTESGQDAANNAITRLVQYLKENPNAGAMAVQKQKALLKKESARKAYGGKTKITDILPVWTAVFAFAGIIFLLVGINGYAGYRFYMAQDSHFEVTESYAVLEDITKRGTEVVDMRDHEYKVKYWYELDGEKISRIEIEKEPFSCRTYYFYRDESGKPIQVQAVKPLGAILFCALGIIGLIFGVLDFTKWNKRRIKARG